MVTQIEIVSGSLFVGNPIVFSLTVPSLADATFRRVELTVEAQLSTDQEVTSLVLSSPVSLSGEDLLMDISSALRTVAEKFEFTRETLETPFIKYNLRAKEEYMQNGTLFTTAETTWTGGTALIGAFSNKERMLGGTDFLPVQQFTRKPKFGELVAQDEILVYPVPFSEPKISNLTQGQVGQVFTFEGMTGAQTTLDGHSVFVVPPSSHRFHFYFVNGLGAVETCSMLCNPEEHRKIESESHVLNRPQSFGSFSQKIVRKQAPQYSYKMSTGPLSPEWEDWVLDEFFMSEQVWVRIKGNYYPCHIIASGDIMVRRNFGDDINELTFTVELDL